MADIDPKTPQTLGIPAGPPKVEKRPTFSAAGKPIHIENNKNGGWRTLLWVAPLTALIWIYAEREQISQAPDVRVQINLLSKSTDRIITVKSPTDRMVSLDIQGPRASVNELREVLAKAPLDIYITPEVGYKGDISLAEPITKSDLFKTYAVTVSAARPPVEIKVEAKAAKRVPVKQHPRDKFVGTVTFEPDSVIVEGPKESLESIKPENLVAYANMSDFVSMPPGSYNREVRISLGSSFVDGVTMKEYVKAKVEIAKSAPYNISALPIVLQLNGLILSSDNFRVTTTPQTVQGIDVVGPADAIESLRQRKFPAAVVIDLTSDSKYDFGGITTTKDIPISINATNFRLPTNVNVLNPARDIIITVTRRQN